MLHMQTALTIHLADRIVSLVSFLSIKMKMF